MDLSKRIKPYVRVLGMNEKGKALLSKIYEQNPKIEIITSVKKYVDSNKDRTIKQFLDIDIKATDVYTLAYQVTSLGNMDYTNSIITYEKLYFLIFLWKKIIKYIFLYIRFLVILIVLNSFVIEYTLCISKDKICVEDNI